MSAAALLLVVTIILISIRLLQLASQAMPPVLYFMESNFVRSILQFCPMLREEYVPAGIWGKSGHLQTVLYGKLGRINSPLPRGDRHEFLMPDGATMTFDVFQPHIPHPSDGDYTLCVCPGIANSSESLYIRTFVHFAQVNGFRVAVLNHLGALSDVPLTSPRIFNYGDTEEYGTMIDQVRLLNPDTQCMVVGFSMGANIVTKYLGESKENQAKVICGISCAQGYDAEKAMRYLVSWEHLRRCYLWAMGQHVKSLLKKNFNILFNSGNTHYDLQRIFKATSLVDIDEFYSRRNAGFKSLQDYYRWCSCIHCIDNIEIPMFFLNSLDDPLVPSELLDVPRKFATKRKNVIFAETRHGGHLGYFQGGMIPETITWLDKVVVQYANAVIQVTESEAPFEKQSI